ncbi:KDO2-lipid IV(A) lauroyltransferase [Cnuella takakiae]|uniref:KDO2-lipid IV(A) lauroyltransferase n=1 Tax=Cnuella takakiae TaxID=1302690 RepID=A0A1M5DQA7_9BACT|nr:lysophospholipid acyltransferase family protein [Cnuella takakiae]OLY93905.1 lipid A biosynthesis acyltransferase [Cnuella takakiae]SHF69218.1 KDO2-lipid IV(A) lauroyltransferase [Cnuella takakiae]
MYYVVYGFLYLLSLLPLRVLHLLSDFFYVIIYHLAGYRKKVVLQNLAIAFPQKTEAERKAIAGRFYRNFCDTFIEMIKLLSASNGFINRHFVFDKKVFDELYAKGKRCQIHLGHNFNWEVGNLAVALNIPHTFLGVYAPLGNKVFDRLIRKLRSRTGSVLLPATEMRTALMPWRNQLYALGLIADQNPSNPSKAFWVPFFGKPTAFFSGPENGARLADIPVVFCYFTKVKRGYYKGDFFLAEEHPAALPKGVLTYRYIQFLERVISESPDMWLWSHRRWKHEWRPEYGMVGENGLVKERVKG